MANTTMFAQGEVRVAVVGLGPIGRKVVQALDRGMDRIPSRTITDRELLKRDLIKVRANGYAVNRGEWREGVWGVAAPIWDATGAVTAALGVSGPANRFQPKALRTLIPLVCVAARDVSTRMGASIRLGGIPA